MKCNLIQWQFFPKNVDSPELLKQVMVCFQRVEGEIDSETHQLPSDGVLGVIRPYLQELGFRVETGKKAVEKIRVPVLFGLNGVPEKSYEADAYHPEMKTVVEIEAGRGVTNYQFLKDLFQACMMNNVEYLVLAIRRIYRTSKDFEKVVTFFDTLYSSDRIKLPLKGVLVIGY